MFQCKLCSYNTNRSFNYKRHLESSHPQADIDESENNSEQTEGKTNFPCPTCYKSFCRKTLLKSHSRVCTKVQNVLQCPFCFKMCSSSGALCNHKKICICKPQHFSDGNWLRVSQSDLDVWLMGIRENGISNCIKWMIENCGKQHNAFRKIKPNVWETYCIDGGWELIESEKLAERLLDIALSRLQKAYDESNIKQNDILNNTNVEDRINAFIMNLCNGKKQIIHKRLMSKITSMLHFSGYKKDDENTQSP